MKRVMKWAGLVLMCFWCAPALVGQVLERPATNELIPTTKEDFWKLGIAAVTPLIIWAIAHLPRIPKPLLPALTPVVGILLGLGLKQVSVAHLSWMDMGQAGGLAVFIREMINQWVTKQVNERRSTQPSPPDEG